MALKNLLLFLGNNSNKAEKKFQDWVKSITGFSPQNISLYHQAFNHKSSLSKNKNNSVSNERLEFLGDAVLGAIIADYLYKIYPYKDEGFLTQLRSKIVNGESLKQLSVKFGFNAQLKTRLSKEEKIKSSAFGDAFEAFVGAVYLDLGYTKTNKFIVSRVIKNHLDIEQLVNKDSDFKSQLQIYCQKQKLKLEYKLIHDESKKNNHLFLIQVFINEKPYVKFENYSKRIAEQKAAELTLLELQKENG